MMFPVFIAAVPLAQPQSGRSLTWSGDSPSELVAALPVRMRGGQPVGRWEGRGGDRVLPVLPLRAACPACLGYIAAEKCVIRR